MTNCGRLPITVRMPKMGKKLLGGAVGVLAVARDVIRHATWYLRYQVDGTPREEDRPGDGGPPEPPRADP